MKTKNQMKPLARLIATSLAVGTMAGFGAQVYAQTAAGTLIKNLATVTYEDENGNEYSAQSNEAVVTVAPVYSAIIEKDNSLSAAPGQTVYFPHVLSNTGNIVDSYTLAASTVSATEPDGTGGTVTTPLPSAVTVFEDLNANGQPDPGEPELSSLDEIEVAAGEQKNIVVAIAVPVDAPDTATYSSTLTASTPNTTVLDENGTTDESNLDTATVSTGPVLVLNKSSVHNVDDQEITYTLTVKNNGGSDATNVNIADALPVVDHDNDPATAGLQVTLVSATSSGLVNTGDALDDAGTVVDTDDLDGDGSVTDTLNAIVATDVTLPPNTTISVTYIVTYAKQNIADLEWAAGESIDNTFTASSTEITVPVSSNTTHDVIPKIYDVDATDTELGPSDGVNDGGDDVQDPDVDDTQYVDVSPTGGEVLFKHIITNDGNSDDIFNLVVTTDTNANGGFPKDTVFTFWDSTGTVQLTDTDDDGVPDTGTLTQDESATIMVKAKLPAGVSGTDFNATLTATSSGDSSVADITALKLGEITAPGVDIANNGLTTGQGMTGIDLTETSPQAENAQNESPAKLLEAAVGGVVVFDLILANESGSADSYLLSAGNTPTGWDVKFKDLDGNVITTTPLIPGGKLFEYKAEVTISVDPSEALHDFDGGVDGYDATNDDNTAALTPGVITANTTDGDKDYQIDFSAASTSTDGLTDTVTNVVDVLPDREVVITPNGQNQIQPGGTVDYSHKIENNGNMDEPVVISVDNTEDGWTTVIKIDTDGDGIPDAVLADGITNTITIPVSGGAPIVIPVTYDTDGNALMTLPAGVDIAISAVVNAPSNAPLGAVNNSTISVADNTGDPDPSPTVTAQDQTNVILGQVRLDKKAAIDEGCDGTLQTGFSADQTAQVKPGDCVVWRLTATNEGSAVVKNVKISDAAPDYTTLQTVAPTPLKLCFGNAAACDAEPLNSAADGTTVLGNIVTFEAWDPAAGGLVDLQPGQKITGEFTVKVD